MLEFYQAYGDYNTGATLIRQLIQEATVAVFGDAVVPTAEGEIDLGGEWPSITLYGGCPRRWAKRSHLALRLTYYRSQPTRVTSRGIRAWEPGKLVEELFEVLVQTTLIRPTFVRDFPLETSPLARRHRDDPMLTEKWDLIGFVMELGAPRPAGTPEVHMHP